jgi:hypothetical protein
MMAMNGAEIPFMVSPIPPVFVKEVILTTLVKTTGSIRMKMIPRTNIPISPVF